MPSLLLATVSLLALFGVACVRRIPEGMVYTLRRWRGQTRVLGAGTHVVLPLFDRVAHKINVAGSTLGFEAVLGGERRQGQVWYQVLDARRADAVIDRVDDLLRARCAEWLSAAEIAAAPDLRGRLKQALNDELRPRGVLVTRVELRGAN